MAGLSTHVLDTGLGRPATGVLVVLERRKEPAGWVALDTHRTDADGRVSDLLNHHELLPGIYRLRFDTAHYFGEQGRASFYPHVEISFEVDDSGQHYHVPLLLSTYGFTTYRGS